ncbi:hypothetical protein [Rhodoferax sp.]|uniref:hypothetical protein n=1 Tax=Rhodoferax sp. TaxID=50421 RepID=UPI0026069871|nr:hypothetical protein [Rhodoferax sp.]
MQPISMVSQRARTALIHELGVVDAMRFLNQFHVGDEGYSVQREQMFKDDTVKSIVAKIKARRNSST